MKAKYEQRKHAQLLSDKLEEITQQLPFKPLQKLKGVTGIIIIRLHGDNDAAVTLIGHINPQLVIAYVIESLNQGQKIADSESNPLAS